MTSVWMYACGVASGVIVTALVGIAWLIHAFKDVWR